MISHGPVTLQRFDLSKYEKIREYSLKQTGQFWIPEEISLQKDKLDMVDAGKAVKHIFTSNLLRQTALDGEQSRFPMNVLGPCASIPELEELFVDWSFFEMLHSRAYSHIIKNIYQVSTEEFNKIYGNEYITEMASNIGKYYGRLYKLNCKKELDIEVDSWDHKKAIWLALHTSYALEAIRFLVSFATSLAMKENKIFMGNGNEIELIMRDELVHTEFTEYLINITPKDDPEMMEISKDIQVHEEVVELYTDVIREEKEWADYLFMEGPVIGLNSNILKEYVDWVSSQRLKKIGLKVFTGPKTNPLPWMLKYTGQGDVQVALQETENKSYILGSMSQELDKDLLPEIEF